MKKPWFSCEKLWSKQVSSVFLKGKRQKKKRVSFADLPLSRAPSLCALPYGGLSNPYVTQHLELFEINLNNSINSAFWGSPEGSVFDASHMRRPLNMSKSPQAKKLRLRWLARIQGPSHMGGIKNWPLPKAEFMTIDFAFIKHYIFHKYDIFKANKTTVWKSAETGGAWTANETRSILPL